jgi:DNA polymerase-1
MPWIETDTLVPGVPHPENHSIYNGLDCMLTLEIFQEITRKANALPQIYSFERALQGPVLEMMLRGFRVDETARAEGIEYLSARLSRLDSILQRYAFAVWDKTLNPRSPKQLIDFFYGAMRLPEQWISQKGIRKLSTNRETLEKLEVYFHAAPIISAILAIRDLSKQREVLLTEIDPDHRMRTSYNIAGTETWRLSSSGSSTGTGRNIQNIDPQLRNIFIADNGWKICGIDLEQAESREVGWLTGTIFDDWRYLDAAYGGDLHTASCKLIWPQMPWTGDKKEDRALADQNFYRNFSFRDMSKRGGHALNYYGTPFTVARHLKVPTKLIEDFQDRYFTAFPAIPKWHKWVAQQLQTTSAITTPWGNTRHFFGRPGDDTTLREAIAFSPQCSTAIRMNLGMWKVWHTLGSRIQLLAQVHDAIYFQMREDDDHAEIISQVLGLLDIRLRHGTHELIVPGEAKVGWNWGSFHECSAKCSPGCRAANPDGLKKWTGEDTRRRSGILERTF